MEDVYIIGTGMIRFNKYFNRNLREMAIEATDLALNDAGLQKKDLQAAFFANTFWGLFSDQHSIRGQVILRSMGIGAIPVLNVENACAGASSALYLAVMGIRAQAFDLALVLGAEKITSDDKMKSLTAYASCMDVENFDKQLQLMADLNKSLNIKIPGTEGAPGSDRSIFMDAYAMGARWHMHTFGTTQEQLAVIAAKNHWHGSMNPLAQYQKAMTTEEVLSDRPVAYPLTRSMCAPIGDGAAACIVCSKRYLNKFTVSRAVRIRASVLATGRDRDLEGEDIGERVARLAYNQAGVSPQDIDLAELHDATAYGELHQTEAMGFCAPGEGGPFAQAGNTRLGGTLPINTSGGLECRGHPIGASGLAQIHELCLQLREQAGPRQVPGARIGLAENGGGNIGLEEAAMCIHILEKV